MHKDTIHEAADVNLPTARRGSVRFIEPPLMDPTLDSEIGEIISTFECHTRSLPKHLQELTQATPAWVNRGRGLSHYLPLWLNMNLCAGELLFAARQMALANRFGQFFCLIQDAVIDQSNAASLAALLPADAVFFQFMRRYQLLFPAPDPFWSYFERYWYDYLDSLAWEKLVCQHPHQYERGDLLLLARKFSPMKVCCAGVAILAKRVDALPNLEELVETVHIGCQILDDLRDWEEDLTRGHWTWPLALTVQALGRIPSMPEVERLLWSDGLARPVAEAAVAYLKRAAEQSRNWNLNVLREWIERYVCHAQSVIEQIPKVSSVAFSF